MSASWLACLGSGPTRIVGRGWPHASRLPASQFVPCCLLPFGRPSHKSRPVSRLPICTSSQDTLPGASIQFYICNYFLSSTFGYVLSSKPLVRWTNVRESDSGTKVGLSYALLDHGQWYPKPALHQGTWSIDQAALPLRYCSVEKKYIPRPKLMGGRYSSLLKYPKPMFSRLPTASLSNAGIGRTDIRSCQV